MATIGGGFGGQLKTCPYNSNHRVKTSRYQRHIAECAKYYTEIVLKECPFNADHKIRSDQMDSHRLNCPDSRSFIRSIAEKSVTEKIPKSELEEYRPQTQYIDEWSDEYMTSDQMTSSANAYDILTTNSLTAQELFDMRFGDNNRSGQTFTDNLFIQKMSYEERKKYNKLCVDRLRDLNTEKRKTVGSDPQMSSDNGSANSTHCIEMNSINDTEDQTQKRVKTTNQMTFRLPNTDPFGRPVVGLSTKRLIRGIGRGSGMSGSAQQLPQNE